MGEPGGIRANGLRKRFGSVQALDGVSFEVDPGKTPITLVTAASPDLAVGQIGANRLP